MCIVYLVLQSTVLSDDINEDDLADFTHSLLSSLMAASPLSSGDLPIIYELLNSTVSLLDNVNSPDVAITIGSVRNNFFN